MASRSKIEIMLLLNFSHPLTPEHIARLEDLTGTAVTRVIAVPTQFDNEQAYLPQLQALMAQVPLTPDEWQTLPMLIVLPALNFITALLLAELHGRMGFFPAIVRLSPVDDATPPRFEVAEILNLQAVRDTARSNRMETGL
jgi:hypothetical protein